MTMIIITKHKIYKQNKANMMCRKRQKNKWASP